MIFNVFPQKNLGYNCYDNNIITVACDCFKRDLSIYLLDNFGFEYDKTNVYSRYKIATCSNYGRVLLNDFLGFQLNYLKKETLDCNQYLKELSKNIREVGIVGIILDSFDCPWNKKYYHSIHMEHAIMITDIDDDCEKVTCFDGFFTLEPQIILASDIFQWMWTMIYFEVRESYMDYKNIGNIFYNMMKKDSNNRANNILKYADIINGQDIIKESEELNGDINTSDLIFAISDIVKSRYNFRYALGTNREALTISDSIIDTIEVLCKKWELMKNYVIMGIYRKNVKYLDSSVDVLKDIAIMEEEIINNICELIENESVIKDEVNIIIS